MLIPMDIIRLERYTKGEPNQWQNIHTLAVVVGSPSLPAASLRSFWLIIKCLTCTYVPTNNGCEKNQSAWQWGLDKEEQLVAVDVGDEFFRGYGKKDWHHSLVYLPKTENQELLLEVRPPSSAFDSFFKYSWSVTGCPTAVCTTQVPPFFQNRSQRTYRPTSVSTRFDGLRCFGVSVFETCHQCYLTPSFGIYDVFWVIIKHCPSFSAMTINPWFIWM